MSGETKTMMHQALDEEYVTPGMCEMHHKVMEGQLELLRQKDKALEDKMAGIERRIDAIDAKIDTILRNQSDLATSTKQFQADVLKYALWLAVGVTLTLFGVATGRVIDFGWLL